MKKAVALLLVVVFVLAFSSVAFAATQGFEAMRDKAPVWQPNNNGVLENENKDGLRFGVRGFIRLPDPDTKLIKPEGRSKLFVGFTW